MQSRTEREREFHNKELAKGERAKVSGVYLVTRRSSERYKQFLSEQAPGKRVLEYGCGANSYAFWLASLSAEVVGIDIADAAISQSLERAVQHPESNRVSFKQMNAEQLEFSDDSFDVICGRAILHHLDLRKAFSELARTLKSGGQSIFVEPLGHNPIINAYRNRTPDLRTPDEHPLLMSDLKLAKTYFGKVEAQYFHLTGLAATPLAGTKAFNSVLNLLDGLDAGVFKLLPFLRKHAWTVVLVFSDPLK
jgi:ubiquinone/menaquinone biosynthesis C-methylase UbiE